MIAPLLAILASPGGIAMFKSLSAQDKVDYVEYKVDNASLNIAKQIKSQFSASFAIWRLREDARDTEIQLLVERDNSRSEVLETIREELMNLLQGSSKRRIDSLVIPGRMYVLPKPRIPLTPAEVVRPESDE